MDRGEIAAKGLCFFLHLYGWLLVCGIWKIITVVVGIKYHWIVATCICLVVYSLLQLIRLVCYENSETE